MNFNKSKLSGFLFLLTLTSVAPWTPRANSTQAPASESKVEAVRTSLSDTQGHQYTPIRDPQVTLERGPLSLTIVDNSPLENAHRAGYNGIASLEHRSQPENLFVPAFAGINLEHIHDGTTRPSDVLYEPRRAEMTLRRIDTFSVELYQPPTPTWKLESATRFSLLEHGWVHIAFECIPRADTFRNGYIGLFWASYIQQPESKAIHFLGRENGEAAVRWIESVSPEHGVLATHLSSQDERVFTHDADFPMSLVFNRSNYRYHRPFYYGVSRGMAFVLVFRGQDQIRFSQSPSGGGSGNPAWDFQWFISPYRLNQTYGFEMWMAYIPFESPDQIERLVERGPAH